MLTALINGNHAKKSQNPAHGVEAPFTEHLASYDDYSELGGYSGKNQGKNHERLTLNSQNLEQAYKSQTQT